MLKCLVMHGTVPMTKNDVLPDASRAKGEGSQCSRDHLAGSS